MKPDLREEGELIPSEYSTQEVENFVLKPR